MQRIDLNGDVGESFGSYTMGDDEAMLRYVTSANVACGFHGGDPSVMRRTVGLAVAGGVAIGAHPGFADLVGFGRREIQMEGREVEDVVTYQIGALAGVTASAEARLHHVKPHGALYNMAARDRDLADAVARAVVAVDSTLILFGLAGSCLIEAGAAVAQRTAKSRAEKRMISTSIPAGSTTLNGTPIIFYTKPLVLYEASRRPSHLGRPSLRVEEEEEEEEDDDHLPHADSTRCAVHPAP